MKAMKDKLMHQLYDLKQERAKMQQWELNHVT